MDWLQIDREEYDRLLDYDPPDLTVENHCLCYMDER